MSRLKSTKPLSKEEKIQDLLRKRTETIDKLTELYKHFHGVKHENSASEIRYTRIKVLEGFVQSINDELHSLGYEIKRG